MAYSISLSQINELSAQGIDVYLDSVKKTTAFSATIGNLQYKYRTNAYKKFTSLLSTKTLGNNNYGDVSASISKDGLNANETLNIYSTYNGTYKSHTYEDIIRLPCFEYTQEVLDLLNSYDLNSVNTPVGTIKYKGDSILFAQNGDRTILTAQLLGADGIIYDMTYQESAKRVRFLISVEQVYTIHKIEVEEEAPPEIIIPYTLPVLDVKTVYKNNVVVSTGETFAVNDTIKFIVKDGYLFDKVSLTVNSIVKQFNISSDKKEASLLFDTESVYSSLVLNQSEIPPFYCYTYTQAEKDKVSNGGIYAYYIGGKTQISVGANFQVTNTMMLKTGISFKFKSAPYFMVDNVPQYFTLSDNDTDATIIFSEEKQYTDLTFERKLLPVYTITQDDLDTFDTGKATLFINGEKAVLGSEISPSDIMTAEAKEGFEFYNNYEGLEDSISVGLYRETIAGYASFETTDFKTASFEMPSNNSYTFYGFYVATIISQPENVKGFNNVYVVNDDNLKELTQKRFVKAPDQKTTVQGDTITVVTEQEDLTDYGKFMLGLINLPMALDEYYVVGQQNIRLASYDTGIIADLISTDNLALNLGSIEIPKEFNNLLDYKNTSALIYLPYSKPIVLDIDYLIGQTITVKYTINLYDGIARIDIYSTKNNGIILTTDVDMSISVPYANIETNPRTSDPTNIQLGGFNGLYKPHIEILRNKSIKSDSVFNANILDEGILNTQKGFIKLEEIDFQSLATYEETEMLKSLLTEGVIIK